MAVVINAAITAAAITAYSRLQNGSIPTEFFIHATANAGSVSLAQRIAVNITHGVVAFDPTNNQFCILADLSQLGGLQVAELF